jgi:Ca2+-binding RTX toxin-like protein
MANIILFEGNRYTGDTTWLAQYYGAQTPTNFEVLDANGILRESNSGINFTYASNGFFNSGTITSALSFGLNGQLAIQATNLNVDVATRNSLLSVGTSGYNYYQYVLRANDNFLGSAGDDIIPGSKGSDVINGAGGIDVLTYRGFGSGVNVNLATGRAITAFGTSILSNIEDIEGSIYGDTLVGNTGNNQIQGFGGADTINGGLGFDTAVYVDAVFAVNVNLSTGAVSGGSGIDSLVSIERVIGSRFNDTLTGSNFNESFLGGFGADIINGGGGIDTVEYNFVGSGVIVNLLTGAVGGSAGNDVLSNIENVSGSIFNDTITGNALANNLNGNGGIDRIDGGAGADTLSSGAGVDTFVFRFGQSTVAGADRITDLAIGSDKIDLLSTTGLALAAPTSLSRAVNSAAANVTALVGQVFLDANGAIAGNQVLGLNSAALVQTTTAGIAGTYLVVNDGVAGFQAATDLLINVTGYSGALPAVGVSAVNSFFI